MDPLADLEKELAYFTERLYTGIGTIQERAHLQSQVQKQEMISTVSQELADSHKQILQIIGKIPDDMLNTNQHQQQEEIQALQSKYEQEVARLQNLQGKAKDIFTALQSNLDSLQNTFIYRYYIQMSFSQLVQRHRRSSSQSKIDFTIVKGMSVYSSKRNHSQKHLQHLLPRLTHRKLSPQVQQQLQLNVTSKLAKEDVVEVVRQLNIVAYERKLNNRHLEIKEKQLVKGFLEGSNQTFISVQTYGKESPLGLVIQKDKGDIDIYYSFSVTQPNMQTNDGQLKVGKSEVHSRYSYFIEKKCYIGLFAKQDSRFSIQHYFGLKAFQKKVRKRILLQKAQPKRELIEIKLEEYRNNPQLRDELDKNVAQILLRRKSMARDIVKYNKNLSFIVNQEHRSKQRKLSEKKFEQVQKRRQFFIEQKQQQMNEYLQKKSIRQQAFKVGSEIQVVLERKTK